jgi:hypothetical protein
MPTTTKKKFEGFSDFEREAMRNRAKELAAEARSSKNKAQGEKAVQDAIADMPEPDRSMAQKVHTLIKEAAPELSTKTWYGMPAYVKDDKIICFFQSGAKYKARYCTLGFNDAANLDKGNMWASAYALKKITASEEDQIKALVKQAVS